MPEEPPRTNPLEVPFRDAWIAHIDDDVIVADKPAGMLSQGVREGDDDDIVARLRRWLSARGEPDALGVHQRLDRETSGLMVFGRTERANRALARDFETRSIEKRYALAVRGKSLGKGWRTIEHVLRREPGGLMRAHVKGPGKRAVLRAREVQRSGQRALVEVDLLTGRTHQARVQLQAVGAPISGDMLYGGEDATRLMLCATALAFTHPNGERMRIERPVPRELVAWARGELDGGEIYDDEALLAEAIERCVLRRGGLVNDAVRGETNAFRLVHATGDGLPGLAVDHYAGYLVASFDADRADGPHDEARQARVLDVLGARGFSGIYAKYRPKQANVLVSSRDASIAPPDPVRGHAASDPLRIVEAGVPFDVRLGDGLSTGLFLDQRDNRVLVRVLAKGRSVLNLFSYTCGFSIAALAGGAHRVVSVDAAEPALLRGREGVALLGETSTERHEAVCAEARAWLRQAARRGERFDLVVCDPPSYSTVKGKRWVLARELGTLIELVLQVVAPGGRLLFSTNHRGTTQMVLRRAAHRALEKLGRKDYKIKDLSHGSDHPSAVGEARFTKSVLMELHESRPQTPAARATRKKRKRRV